jgi:hypothetical protein
MGVEYKIKFCVPENYDPSALFKKLPSPIGRPSMTEIYNFKIEHDGFYFVDHLVNNEVASVAFRFFVNEALSHAESVEIVEP